MRGEADAGMMELAGLANGQESHGLLVEFYVEPQKDEEASKREGRPVFRDVEICQIRIPGDSDIRRDVVSEDHRKRFAREYLLFKQGKEDKCSGGVPLKELPGILKSQVEEARYFGVYAIEQLAVVTDVNLQRMGPGWVSIRQSAQDWLKRTKEAAPLAKLRAENEELRQRLATLEEMLKRQGEELHKAQPSAPAGDIAALVAEQVRQAMAAQQANGSEAPRRRGRPKKTVEPPATEQ